MFELKNITKTFGSETALRNVFFSINGGMNYIIGASGSGKTTLLRILSAMDTEYEGEAFYNNKNLKSLTVKERSQLYAMEIGFIAQGFHLIGELTVRENILVPAYLKSENPEKLLNSLLKKLNIENLADQKVSTLSGGQKQRVAIARELMKNPKVLIADEPTAALDSKTAHEIGKLLSDIAKERTVIVVTHDTSLVQGKCSVFELYKGSLSKCSQADNAVDNAVGKQIISGKKNRLTIRSAISIVGVTCRRQTGKLLSLLMAMTVAALCLMVNFNGILDGSSEQAFRELIDKQGNAVLNLTIVSSFMGASEWEISDEKSQSVDQDISGLMEKYQDDSRVEAILMEAPVDDMVVTLDGKDFIVQNSGQAPVFNKMLVGKIADNSKKEIVLPQILVKKLGRTNEEMIGKELSFIGNVFNWDSGQPVSMPVEFIATVSGVADTSYGVEFEGEVFKYEDEDALFPSLAVVQDIYEQAGKKEPSFSFTIRPDSPEHYLEIYDEMMSDGIVPLGEAELIRDIVGLKGNALTQTGVAYTLIAILSVLAVFSVVMICSLMRKKEYAVYKLSGYTKADIAVVTLMEYGVMFIVSSLLIVIVSAALHTTIWLGLILSLVISAACFTETCLISANVKPLKALKTGGRS